MQNINISSVERKGACARGIAEAVSAWIPDPAEKTYVIGRATPSEIESKYYASDSTAPLAELIAGWLEADSQEVLCGFYDNEQPICRKAAEFVPTDRRIAVLELLSAVKAGWTKSNQGKYFDPERSSKRYMHLATNVQPWANIFADWLFIKPVANEFLHLELTAEEAKGIWLAHLRQVVNDNDGISSDRFHDFAYIHSVGYVRNGPKEEFERGFEQLVRLLRKEL